MRTLRLARKAKNNATVSVDRGACVGSGICEVIARHLFTLGPDHISVPTQPTLTNDDEVDAAVDAAHSCPTAAIAVDSDGCPVTRGGKS
jgi:ferredoxin